MKQLASFLLFFAFAMAHAQSDGPVFPGCETETDRSACFAAKLQAYVYDHFTVPGELQSYVGEVVVLFEVTEEGKFQVLYVNTTEAALEKEARSVFASIAPIKPGNRNGVPVYTKYTHRIAIPLQKEAFIAASSSAATAQGTSASDDRILHELDTLKSRPFEHRVYSSNMNIPFTHVSYAAFEAEMNIVGSNNHTGYKPYLYSDVKRYFDMKAEHEKLFRKTSSWWGRKIWNENLAQFQGQDYWFTLNPMLDVRVGKSDPSDFSYTYQNTRALQVQGGLGDNLTFTTTIYESQGRFADYYNAYAASIAPSGGNPAIIPGIGIAKDFKTDAFDFPSAEANLSYSPSRYFNLQLGYGRNFIGDGYRSLILGDAASPYPYVKLHSTFWKIRYTNTYMWLKDVRDEVTVDRTYATKFMANHYLSLNVTNRLNLGFFESVIWANTNDRGFDINFVNPIIFYRSVEFASSGRSGNAALGLTFKYKWKNNLHFYGQFFLDEFSLGAIKDGNQSWLNKYGYQLGATYTNAFTVPGLTLQVEYNHVRPYVYSHSDPLTNYGHNNQSMGHPWGGNFRELLAIARYRKGRYYADAKLTYGVRGLDFNTADDSFNYGGDIYRNYNEDRPYDTGVKIGQGNKTTLVIADLQAGYLVNPTTNLRAFASLIVRNANPEMETPVMQNGTTTWFMVGIRSELFNMYFDY